MSTSSASPSITQLDREDDIRQQEPDEARAEASRWIKEIKNTSQMFQKWNDRAEEICKRYRDEREDVQNAGGTAPRADRKFNVFWSIVQTAKPHLFMEPPKPYVHRNHMDRDPAARDAALIMQRALEHASEADDITDALDAAVDDFQLAGRGTTWVRYTPTFSLRPSVDKHYISSPDEVPGKDEMPNGFETGTDEGGFFYQPKVMTKTFERADSSHVLYSDFLHEMAGQWEHVGWVARKVPMTFRDIKKRFGAEIAEKIPFKSNKSGGQGDNDNSEADDFKGLFRRAPIWEIWNKNDAEVIWVCLDYPDQVLDKQPDLYELADFFPCPRPIWATTTSDSLIPVPDYAIYQGLLTELDEVTHRIKLLTQACRIAGAYDAQNEELSRIVKQTQENDLIPVDNWAAFAERGGLKGSIDFLPLADIAAVVDKLQAHRRVLTQELYEISGIADVVRGASDYRETAEAQQIKGDFATMRLRRMQRNVARHARDILRIKGEIIARHFSDDEIKKISAADQVFIKDVQQPAPMTPQQQAQFSQAAQQAAAQGQQPPQPPMRTVKVFDEERFDAALALLRDETSTFRINIDTETLGGMKKRQESAERIEFLGAVGQYMNQVIPAAREMPQLGPLMAKLLQFGVRGFPIGRSLEAEIDQTVEELLKSGAAGQQQGNKSPEELEIEKQKLQIESKRLELEAAKFQAQQQHNMGLLNEKMGRLQGDMQSRARDAAQREQRILLDAQLRDKQIEQSREAARLNAQNAEKSQRVGVMKLGLEDERKRTETDQRLMETAADKATREADRAYSWQQKQDEMTHDSIERNADRRSAERQAAARKADRPESGFEQ